MANPLDKLLANPSFQARLLRVLVFCVGIARDFWKDTPFPKRPPKIKKAAVPHKQSKTEAASLEEEAGQNIPKPWFADFIQVKEQIWGEGNVFPGGEAYLDDLTAPLGLDSTKSVIDLSAGIGGLARKLAFEHNIYVTSFEPDKRLASRGMVMSIAAGKAKQAPVDYYEPAEFKVEKKYDCIFARELFYRVIAKEKLFSSIASALKKREGQLVFTDYILDDANRANPAVKVWLAHERGAAPLPYIDMVKEWKGLGFDMRVAEDQTDFYRESILKALAEFSEFLKNNHPSPETKPAIVKEIDLWARRLAAFEGGLRYCRFYGIKK